MLHLEDAKSSKNLEGMSFHARPAVSGPIGAAMRDHAGAVRNTFMSRGLKKTSSPFFKRKV